MTQQQIDTMTGILEGREFSIDDKVYWYDSQTGYLYFEDCGTEIGSLLDAGDLIRLFKAGKITLVPQPPEPLSDEMGEACVLIVRLANELNVVRARYGAEHFSICAEVWDNALNEANRILLDKTGHGYHCHPSLYSVEKNKEAV